MSSTLSVSPEKLHSRYLNFGTHDFWFQPSFCQCNPWSITFLRQITQMFHFVSTFMYIKAPNVKIQGAILVFLYCRRAIRVGGGLNQDLQNYKWNPLWLYMRLWDVKRFFEKFSVLTLHRPPQISEKWGKMAHFGRFPTFSYWLVWSLNY